MADTVWIDNMRQIMMKAVDAGEPCDILQGEVVSAAPPEVRLNQKITLSGPQLILPQYLTDHTVDMDIPGVGSVTVTVKGALKTGDVVFMLQKRGGQQYLIMARR